ncbi:hypothetical protein QKW35_14765 [Pontibacterium granulatum]|uniref:hypothetical protein n=1 Tax=Pontibacterium granulatum TaxID=2036029 RepID=UPI00249B4330|nr:hypothetical protein [Pontibacterium granulatum]MDI3325638.1 hypothetical protein [Pontibacterium granulatum]
MKKRAFAFEMAVSFVLMALGLVLVQLGLPGYGLVVVAAILMGLSFVTRKWVAQTANVKVAAPKRGNH